MLELNKIYNMDCVDGMKQLSDNSIDLTVTSPPYDDLRKYRGYSFDFESVAKELYRVTKGGGVVVWVVGDQTINGSESGTSFKQALYFKEVGFNLHDTMIYQKNVVTFPDANRYFNVFEYMFVFSKGKPKVVNFINDRKNKHVGVHTKKTYRESNGELKSKVPKTIKENGRRNNIWLYDVGKNKSTKDNIAFEHPAIFPEQLVSDHIISWCNKGEIVLDPFMGSGTTAKMAIINNRNFIGFEISEAYCKIANKRIDYYSRQQKLDLGDSR